MEKYIIFFGKSQSFEFHAFDSNGIINNFDIVIKDFELLESKWFTVDNLDNKPMLSRYEFLAGGKKFSMLKLYGFAQAADGARVEGSTYGIAFLSEDPLLLSVGNIQLLSGLKKYFTDLCLVNSKFTKANFREDAFSIWKAFANQIGYKKIETGEYFSQFDMNIHPIAFYVDNIELSARIPNSFFNKSSMVYFSEDLEHLKRTRLKWDRKFKFYVNTNGELVEYKDPEKPKITSPQQSFNRSDISEVRASELERELAKIKKKSAVDKLFYKKTLLFITALFVIALGLNIYMFFSKSTEDTPLPNDIAGSNNKDSIIKSNTLSVVLIDSLLVDSSRSANLDVLLSNIKEYKKTKSSDSIKIKSKMTAIIKSGKKLNIDSNQIIKLIKK